VEKKRKTPAFKRRQSNHEPFYDVCNLSKFEMKQIFNYLQNLSRTTVFTL